MKGNQTVSNYSLGLPSPAPVIYGKGSLGKLAMEILKELGIHPVKQIDSANAERFISGSKFTPETIILNCVATAPDYIIKKYLVNLGVASHQFIPFWDYADGRMDLHNGWRLTNINTDDGDITSRLCEDSSIHEYRAFKHWRFFREDILAVDNKWFTWHSWLPFRVLPSTLQDIYRRRSIGYSVYEGWWEFHNEGLELQTLWVCMNKIMKARPKIMVACYHSEDGLVKIPRLLMQELAYYKWYFKRRAYMGQAAFLYGIPYEDYEGGYGVVVKDYQLEGAK